MEIADTINITLLPQGLTLAAPRGVTVLEALRTHGLTIAAPCGGNGPCGKCRVRLSAQTSAAAGLSPLSDAEAACLPEAQCIDGIRLACQAQVLADVALELLPVADESTAVSKAITSVDAVLEPAVRLCPFTCGPEDGSARLDRCEQHLYDHYDLPELTFDLAAVRQISQITAGYAAVWQNREVLAIRRDNVLLGAALDIGTTSLAVYLCDLTSGTILQSLSELNPQAAYGADVLSRISYQQEHPERLGELNRAVITALNDMLNQACQKAGHTAQDILDVTVACNPTMLHLFLGVSPNSIGVRPFAPVIGGALDIKARELGLAVNAAAYVHCLPGLLGFVGSDVIADVVALREKFAVLQSCLLLDIGTNGEIVLKHKHGWLAAACATGPALEGAQISCGTRAVSGAVEHVRIAPDTLAISVKLVGYPDWVTPGVGSPLPVAGICGSGVIDLVSRLYKAGLLEQSGRFAKQADTARLVLADDGTPRFVLYTAAENAAGREISLTQADVRAVQAAKGALAAGCRLLMQKAGLERVDAVLVAGAFGQHIDVHSACDIGLFPTDCIDVEFTGNSAGYGALLTLLDVNVRREAQRIAQAIEYVELAEEPGFNAAFTGWMAFPANGCL